MKKYDVIVIGSGPGGTAAAYDLRAAGREVAIVEEGDWGGTCPNTGCDPKKVLVSGMEVVQRNNQLADKGFSPITTISWPELMAFKRTFTDPFPEQFKRRARDKGIDTITGTAKFLDERWIEVDGQTFEADNYVIATGQHPAILDIEGREHLKTSADFLDMDELPPSIIFIGAGYIAFELAAIANAAGSEVTLIDHGSRPLRGFDGDLVDELMAAYWAKGIGFAFDVDIERVARTDGGFTVSGGNYEASVACVICAAGRVPSIERLDLDKAGVKYDKGGVLVDGERLHLRLRGRGVQKAAQADPRVCL